MMITRKEKGYISKTSGHVVVRSSCTDTIKIQYLILAADILMIKNGTNGEKEDCAPSLKGRSFRKALDKIEDQDETNTNQVQRSRILC